MVTLRAYQAAAEQERVVAHDTTSSSAQHGWAVRVSLLRVLRLGLRDGGGRAGTGSATPSITLAFAKVPPRQLLLDELD